MHRSSRGGGVEDERRSLLFPGTGGLAHQAEERRDKFVKAALYGLETIYSMFIM